MRNPLKLTILSALLLLVAASVAYAAADGVYRGTTDQQRKATVRVSAGAVQAANVPFVADDCNRGDGYSITARKFLYDAPFGGTKKIFKSSGKVTIGTTGGKAVVTRTLRGVFSGKRVSGVQRVTIKSKDKFGRHTCKSRVAFKLKLGA
jgi:hypothetical protein